MKSDFLWSATHKLRVELVQILIGAAAFGKLGSVLVITYFGRTQSSNLMPTTLLDKHRECSPVHVIWLRNKY